MSLTNYYVIEWFMLKKQLKNRNVIATLFYSHNNVLVNDIIQYYGCLGNSREPVCNDWSNSIEASNFCCWWRTTSPFFSDPVAVVQCTSFSGAKCSKCFRTCFYPLITFVFGICDIQYIPATPAHPRPLLPTTARVCAPPPTPTHHRPRLPTTTLSLITCLLSTDVPY